MPLLKGKSEIGHNVKEMEAAGHPKKQAVAAALREAGVPKARDMATAPNSGLPQGGMLRDPGKMRPDYSGSGGWSATAQWKGRRV